VVGDTTELGWYLPLYNALHIYGYKLLYTTSTEVNAWYSWLEG